MLLSAPNVSEGRDGATIAAIAAALTAVPAMQLLDVHSDADHNRSVFTLAGAPGDLPDAVIAVARVAVERIDLRDHVGVHPRVGVLDVVPFVYLYPDGRGGACAAALVAADLIARELHVPVFLYGELTGGRSRADLRRGGPHVLGARIAMGELQPDFGPARLHASAGATLVGARPPLVAFNVELGPGFDVDAAREIAARIRDGGREGLPGVRALGLELRGSGIVQVSTNVENHVETPLAAIVEAVRKHAPVTRAELVGLAPRAALDGFPDDVELRGFDPERHLIENALRV